MSVKRDVITKKNRARAFVFHPELSGDETSRSTAAKLQEAVGLTAAIDLEVETAESFTIQRARPDTLIGAGKVDEIRHKIDTADTRPTVVVVNRSLSPVQHRNLEKEWETKVLDRTALILEIFGARAQTAEGRLQVDLAHLSYQRSRLVRSWTHLERQRGGAGFLGGPGERQIEADRRALANKIDRLKGKLEQVRRTRCLQRSKRKRAPHPVVALVGYTNAGKSTFFNHLTKSDVFAKDLLFATLDPTMRKVDLPSGQRIILSDTVGFISDLPTQLVAAFQATLEEVLEADVILHMRDVSHEDTEAQRSDVINVLEELGMARQEERAVIEVLNKIDQLGEEPRAALVKKVERDLTHDPMAVVTLDDPYKIPVSALLGHGVDDLCALIDELVTADRDIYEIRFSENDGAARAWLHRSGDVIDETSNDGALLTVRLSKKACGQFVKAFPKAQLSLTTKKPVAAAHADQNQWQA